MASFKFSLQPVLDHRMIKEEQAQRIYGEAQARLETIRRQQDQAREAIARSIDFIHRRQQHGITFEERVLHEQWIEAQELLLKEYEEKALRLAKEVETKRLELVRAMQDRTVMEKLREREREENRKAENRAELKLFDEIAVRDYINTHQRAEIADPAERIAG